MELSVEIGSELKDKCPEMVLGTILCEVHNEGYNNKLWEELIYFSEDLKTRINIEEIKEFYPIKKTREVYKACGKKPGRYRPAAEALMRRMIKGNYLTNVNSLVDTVNFISLKTGFSMGAFDYNKINGGVRAGIGFKNEHFCGIGRGKVNIEGLPVLRDEKGPIGTPTTDEERTAVSADTKKLYLNINGYTGTEDTKEVIDFSKNILRKYLSAKNITSFIVY